MNRSVINTLCLLPLLLCVGCPHRSPVWSPDGSQLLLLSGPADEVEKAASRLWVVDPEKQSAIAIAPPQPGVRFLAVLWITDARALVVTGKWDDGYIAEGSEKTWELALPDRVWKPLSLPRPSEARVTMRPPILLRDAQQRAVLVYPAGDEAVVAVRLNDGKTVQRIEPAELVGGAGPSRFLIQRPEPGDSGEFELVAMDLAGKGLWRRSFAPDLRDAVAEKVGAKPLAVVFNDTSSSHIVPAGPGDARPRLGLSLVFSDVSWKKGVNGYYVELDRDTGELLHAVEGRGVWGRPVSVAGVLRAVAAGEGDAPLRLVARSLTGKESLETVLGGLKALDVFGYSTRSDGKRFVVSIGGAKPAVRIYRDDDFAAPLVVQLRDGAAAEQEK